jgi:hypothetical protein
MPKTRIQALGDTKNRPAKRMTASTTRPVMSGRLAAKRAIAASLRLMRWPEPSCRGPLDAEAPTRLRDRSDDAAPTRCRTIRLAALPESP